MLKSGGILVGFVRPMYAFGRPRELRSRGLIKWIYRFGHSCKRNSFPFISYFLPPWKFCSHKGVMKLVRLNNFDRTERTWNLNITQHYKLCCKSFFCFINFLQCVFVSAWVRKCLLSYLVIGLCGISWQGSALCVRWSFRYHRRPLTPAPAPHDLWLSCNKPRRARGHQGHLNFL